MASEDRRAALRLLALALGLAALGQYAFARKSASVWDGVAWYVAAGAALAAAIAHRDGGRVAAETTSPGIGARFWAVLRHSPARAVLLALALVGSGYVALAALQRPPSVPRWDLLLLWMASVAVALGVFDPGRALPARLRALGAALTRDRWETALVAALALGTLLLRAVNLETIPYVLSGDEASMGLEAVAVLDGTRTNPFTTGWLSHPTLYFFLQAASLRLLGVTVAGLRATSALVAVPTVILLYLLARRLYGRWVAALAALFFAGYHYAIHYGRIALNNIWDPFFALGALYLGLRGVDERRPAIVALGGAMLGMAWYFYMGARLIPLLLLVALVLRARRTPGYWREALPLLVTMGLVALVVALPLLAHFRAAPETLGARWKLTSMLADGRLASEAERTGRTPLAIMGAQLLRAALAFHYYPDPTFHYRPGVPLLSFGAAVLFTFGLVTAARRIRRPENGLLLAWLGLVVVFGGALLENPPSSARLVLAIPPAVLAVALGAVEAARILRWALGRSHAEAVAATLIVMALITGESTLFYFFRYTPSHVYGGVNTAVAHQMGLYLRGLGPGRYVYFLGPPRMYLGFATIPFLARDLAGRDVLDVVSDPWTLPAPAGAPVFIMLPERRAELDVVRRRYPAGALRDFRDASGTILFSAYEPLE